MTMPVPLRAGTTHLRTGVLLVEDDARIRQALSLALADAGFDIMEAATGEQALERLGSADVDLVVLDVMLPGVDGLTICRTVRARSDLPIVIVTARSDTADVIEGLEAGADDYMTKPVVASELAARIRALLRRRRNPKAAAPTTIGDVTVSFDQGVARRGHQELHLTKTDSGCWLNWLPPRDGSYPASSCCSRCGDTTTSATPGCSMCTSGGFDARLRPTLTARF